MLSKGPAWSRLVLCLGFQFCFLLPLSRFFLYVALLSCRRIDRKVRNSTTTQIYSSEKSYFREEQRAKDLCGKRLYVFWKFSINRFLKAPPFVYCTLPLSNKEFFFLVRLPSPTNPTSTCHVLVRRKPLSKSVTQCVAQRKKDPEKEKGEKDHSLRKFVGEDIPCFVTAARRIKVFAPPLPPPYPDDTVGNVWLRSSGTERPSQATARGGGGRRVSLACVRDSSVIKIKSSI